MSAPPAGAKRTPNRSDTLAWTGLVRRGAAYDVVHEWLGHVEVLGEVWRVKEERHGRWAAMRRGGVIESATFPTRRDAARALAGLG